MPKGKTTKENRWQCIEFYLKRYPGLSREECQKMLDDKLKSRRESHPTNINYWIKKYPNKTLEECTQLHQIYTKSHNYSCIEYYQRLYPDLSLEECQKLKEERVNIATKKHPDSKGFNNPSHKSKTTEKQRRERSVLCIEYWEKKYPNKTKEEYEKMVADKKAELVYKARHALQPTQKEYWMNKGYTEEEAIKKVSERQRTFTLEKCIEKYGAEEGLRRFNERQEKWMKSLKNTFEKTGRGIVQSQLALNIINKIKEQFDIETEFAISRYSYDIRYKNKLIEINGDYWHCNPDMFEPSYFNKVNKMTAKRIWEKDKRKADCAKNKGYELLVIWESDYNQDPSNTLKKCLDFLND